MIIFLSFHETVVECLQGWMVASLGISSTFLSGQVEGWPEVPTTACWGLQGLACREWMPAPRFPFTGTRLLLIYLGSKGKNEYVLLL